MRSPNSWVRCPDSRRLKNQTEPDGDRGLLQKLSAGLAEAQSAWYQIDIPQAEADALIAMEKRCVEQKTWLFPEPGDRLSIALTSPDKRENFFLDITRAQIKITKATYQNRARQAIIFMRLDLDGPPHRNPDEQEIPCPHLHI